MEQLHLTFYETPKHGYLRVPGEICRKLNISQSFGPFSYYFFETDEEDPDSFCQKSSQEEIQNLLEQSSKSYINKSKSKRISSINVKSNTSKKKFLKIVNKAKKYKDLTLCHGQAQKIPFPNNYFGFFYAIKKSDTAWE